MGLATPSWCAASPAPANPCAWRSISCRQRGAGRSRPIINLYVGKVPIKFNIPEAEAVDKLVDLIKEHGKWAEPEEKTAAEMAAH